MITTSLLLLAASRCFPQVWLPVGDNNSLGCYEDNLVYDINVSDDNQSLYLAGWITSLPTCPDPELKATVKWDGQNYSRLANHNGTISSIAFDYNGKVYSGGYLIGPQPSPINYFNYKDENGNWALVPSPINGTIMDYHIHDGIAYLAGSFRYCDGAPCAFVCTFDGEQVLPYYLTNEPQGSNPALGVTFYQDTLFVTGNIDSPVSSEANSGYANLMKIVDGELQKVDNGFVLDGIGTALEVMDNKLYVVGRMREISGDQLHTIYYYENGQLHTLPEEPNDLIYSMTKYQDALYVAGGFTQIGNTPCSQVARWDGQQWTCLCYDFLTRVAIDENGDTIEVMPCEGNCIRDIAVWNDTLYIAGGFHKIGNAETRYIAKLDMALSEAFPVNITEQQKQEVKMSVYPNPANDKLNIQLDKPSVVSVYTATGQLLETYTSKSTYQIDVSHYPAGLYLVVCGGVSKRFVRQ